MTKAQIVTDIVEIWREIARLKEKVADLESIIKQKDKEIEQLKEVNKTTLSKITMDARKDEMPIPLSQQVLEEWMLDETERKALEQERKTTDK